MLADYEGLVLRLRAEQVAFLISERSRLDTEAAELAAQEEASRRAQQQVTLRIGTPQTRSWEDFAACVIRHESGGVADAQNRYSSASGLFQDLDSTWGGYGGYAHAKDAPESVQYAMNFELWQRAGASPWAGSGC